MTNHSQGSRGKEKAVVFKESGNPFLKPGADGVQSVERSCKPEVKFWEPLASGCSFQPQDWIQMSGGNAD